MEERTLVLNESYKVVSVISWQRAVTLLYSKSAETVMYWDAAKQDFTYYEYERSVSNSDKRFVYRIPSIIRLLKSTVIPKKYLPKFSKINVFYRDNFECQYCGLTPVPKSNDKKKKESSKLFLTIDHVLPVSRGGKTTFDNCVCACSDCNRSKSNKTPEEAKIKLKRKPSAPSYEVLAKRRMTKKHFPEAWLGYMKF
jgi:5-methylcytosine-specific restriction endonuclease McrA